MSQTIGTSGGTITATPVTVGTSATTVLAAGDYKQVTFINNSSQVIDLGGAGVTAGAGIPLQAGGGSFSFTPQSTSPGTAQTDWYAVSPSGGADLRVITQA
jgi:hypothetical protein